MKKQNLLILLTILVITLSLTVGLAAALQSAPAGTPSLSLNEFMADNATTLEDPDEPGEFPDWLELYNNSDTPVNLAGLYLTDDLSNTTKFQITGSLVISPYGFLLFYADDETVQGPQHTNFKLSAGGEALALVAADGSTILDSFTFGPQSTDISQGRFPDGTGDWYFFNAPTPGGSNNTLSAPVITGTARLPLYPAAQEPVQISAYISDPDGTVVTATLYYSSDGLLKTKPLHNSGGNLYAATIPGAPAGTQVQYYLGAGDNDGLVTTDPAGAPANQYSYLVGYSPPTLYINEFLADNATILQDPDDPGEFPDWIELYNPSLQAINLNGYYLSDDLGNPTKYRLEQDLILPALGFVLFYADDEPEQGVQHLNFKLSSTNGEDLVLSGPDQIILDSYSFGPQETDISEGRLPDGGPNWQFFSVPTPGGSNSVQPPLISDTMHQPPSPGSSDTVTVTSRITDDGLVITATLYYSATGSYVAQPMTPAGDDLYLATIPPFPDNTVVHYYVAATDNDNLTSTDPPTAPAGAYLYIVGYSAPPLFINEFLADNATVLEDPDDPGEFPDWFEIYNPGVLPVDLNGYYLSDNPDNPTKYQVPASVIVPAQGFVLFYADDEVDQGPQHTNFKLSSTNGESLLLTGADGLTLVDSHTFGPQATDISEGRLPDGGPNWVLFESPTPGLSNLLTPPVISQVTIDPAGPTASDPVQVSATIQDDGQVISATLYYSATGSYTALPMTPLGNDQYQATIPPLPDGTLVVYYLTATDNDGLHSSAPNGAPGSTFAYLVGYATPGVVLNEIMALNTHTLEDPNEPGEFPDWIELHNPAGTPASLDGLYLSNDPAQPFKFPIPAGITVPPHGFVLFYADNEPGQGIFHTNFKLSSDGDFVGLYGLALLNYPMLDAHSFNTQVADISIGRCPDGSGPWQYFLLPTPGWYNCRAIYLPFIGQAFRP